jgi:DNA polymerase-1
VIKRTQTGPSTDIEVLERLAEREGLPERGVRVAELTVEYRQLSKLVNTYLDALAGAVRPTTGRVHASFHQTGAATGRLSSSDPNLQNIPIRTDVGRMIRKAFLPAEGWSLIAADYSQIELRVLAHLSGDAGLARAFHEDLDIHAAVASQVFGVSPEAITPQQRTHAKTINFGIVYGVTPHGLARRIESLDVEGARRLIGEYHRKFPGISRFLDRCVAQAESLGYVTTILGRRRPIPQVQSHNRSVKSLGERLAINTVVQGSAADLIKLAMVAVHRRIESQRLPLKLLLQIHDELVLESPIEVAREMAEVVREEMVGAMKLSVPLKVGVGLGPSWYEAK